MDRTELYEKTNECIARFKNGKEKYQKSALFNMIIQQLARGVDPYEVIEQLIQTTEDTQKAFEQYMYRDTRPTVML